jgi:hypothetical protein
MIISRLALLSLIAVVLCTVGCGSIGGSTSTPPSGPPPPAPDSYTRCRYTTPPPVPEPGYVIYNYLSNDHVRCPAPSGSGLVYTVVEFKNTVNQTSMEVCQENQIDGYIPTGWSVTGKGSDLTQCSWEPVLQPAPEGPQTIIITKNP